MRLNPCQGLITGLIRINDLANKGPYYYQGGKDRLVEFVLKLSYDLINPCFWQELFERASKIICQFSLDFSPVLVDAISTHNELLFNKGRLASIFIGQRSSILLTYYAVMS
jgi:hypothetical protein